MVLFPEFPLRSPPELFMIKMARVTALLLIAVVASVALLADAQSYKKNQITYLPGLVTQPTYDMYSGYITLDNGQNLFYWLIESSKTPAADQPCTFSFSFSFGFLKCF
tara:strand:+ start:737 stop:1060 length:324 start_codon:yes stop_codon:yes gene_type:complete